MRVIAPGKPKDPFSAALDALRAELRHGRLILGEPLTITELAHKLGLSATPVREALSRLAGEGLIEDRRGRGYFAHRIDGEDLADLYGLRRIYLAEAIKAQSGLTDFVADDATDPPEPGLRVTEAFDQIAARAGNRALFEAYRQVSDRLAPAIRVEGRIFHLDDEWRDLDRAFRSGGDSVIATIDHLHTERRSKAAEVVRAMRACANIASL